MATKIFKKISDPSIRQTWAPILEGYGATSEIQAKRPWLSDYAHYHAIFDQASPILESMVTPGLFLQQPGSISAMGVTQAPTNVQTPFSGFGSGSITKNAYGQTGTAASQSGSGDKFPSLLPVAIQVAAKTIGFDLVGVVPMDSPVGFLPYLDYVYQGGNTGTQYAPFMVTVPAISSSISVGQYINPSGTYSDFVFEYVGKSRVNGLPILKVVEGSNNNSYSVGAALASISATAVGSYSYVGSSAGFSSGTGTAYVGLGLSSPYGSNIVSNTNGFGAVDVQLVSALENAISGFTSYSDSNWNATDGSGNLQGPFLNTTSGLEPQGMLRADAEASRFRQMGLRLFTKYIEARGDQVAISATVEQIQDLNRVWNYDVISMLENFGVNEVAQSINKKLVDRVLALGSTHATEVDTVEGTGAGSITGVNLTVGSTGFENISTLQRRIVTKMLEMANLIYHRGRFGAGTHIVTNGRVAAALADVAGYSFAPFNNDLPSGPGQLYPAGKVYGMTVYVDPNLKFSDTRIHIGRKGADEEPGVKFMPYIMAESLQTIAEGTFSPKIGIKSRYAITEAGWHPETQYLTINVTGLGVLTGTVAPSSGYAY